MSQASESGWWPLGEKYSTMNTVRAAEGDFYVFWKWVGVGIVSSELGSSRQLVLPVKDGQQIAQLLYFGDYCQDSSCSDHAAGVRWAS